MTTDQEKSVMLAGAMGETWVYVDEYKGRSPWHYIEKDQWFEQPVDFYNLINMHLAWQVHLWALKNAQISYYYEKWGNKNLAIEVNRNDKIITLIGPFWYFESAQRLLLDKVLSLVIEHRLTKTDDVPQ